MPNQRNRERPDESDNNSFPSGHSSASFSAATLANRNLDSIGLSKKLRRPLQAGNLLLATGAAWARVEGRKHFPSDVLAGAALGHFLTAFIHDAFLGLPAEDKFSLVIISLDGGASAQLSFHF
jgi:membrane-associated phospholipid phosphatase